MEVFEGSKRHMGIGTEEDREGEIEKERTRSGYTIHISKPGAEWSFRNQ